MLTAPTSPARAWLARQLYSTLLRLGTPAYLWRGWSRGRDEPAYRHFWPQRLGWHTGPAWQADARSPVIWLHAVSLGETRAGTPLVQALRASLPGLAALRHPGCRAALFRAFQAGRRGADGNRGLPQPDARGPPPRHPDGAGQRTPERQEPATGAAICRAAPTRRRSAEPDPGSD